MLSTMIKLVFAVVTMMGSLTHAQSDFLCPRNPAMGLCEYVPNPCFNDGDCYNGEICCPHACSRKCKPKSSGVGGRGAGVPDLLHHPRVYVGKCPNSSCYSMFGGGANECDTSKLCPDQKYCCNDGCKNVCVWKPEVAAMIAKQEAKIRQEQMIIMKKREEELRKREQQLMLEQQQQLIQAKAKMEAERKLMLARQAAALKARQTQIEAARQVAEAKKLQAIETQKRYQQQLEQQQQMQQQRLLQQKMQQQQQLEAKKLQAIETQKRYQQQLEQQQQLQQQRLLQQEIQQQQNVDSYTQLIGMMNKNNNNNNEVINGIPPATPTNNIMGSPIRIPIDNNNNNNNNDINNLNPQTTTNIGQTKESPYGFFGASKTDPTSGTIANQINSLASRNPYSMILPQSVTNSKQATPTNPLYGNMKEVPQPPTLPRPTPPIRPISMTRPAYPTMQTNQNIQNIQNRYAPPNQAARNAFINQQNAYRNANGFQRPPQTPAMPQQPIRPAARAPSQPQPASGNGMDSLLMYHFMQAA